MRVEGLRKGSGEMAVVSRKMRSQSSSGRRGMSKAGVKGFEGYLEGRSVEGLGEGLY